MSNDIKEALESFLLRQPGWTSSSEICFKFGVKERALRGEDGLLAGCTISSDEGYKHVARANDTDFKHWRNRIRDHAVSELMRIKRLTAKRVADRQAMFPF